MLAFLFGYGIPLWPLRRVGMAWGTALGLAFASDTLFMATMELVDNTIMLVDHEKANKLMLFNDNGKTCATSSCSNHWPSATLNQRAVGYAPAGPCRTSFRPGR